MIGVSGPSASPERSADCTATVAASHQRDTESRKVTRADAVHPRIHILTVLRAVAFDGDAAVGSISIEHPHAGDADRLNAGHRAKRSLKLFVELTSPSRIVAGQSRIHREGDQVGGPESRIEHLQVLQRADKQA